MLNAVANIPKGNAPIPNDIWKPPSPNPKPWNPPLFSGSGLCPWGRGGVFSLGSCCPVLPLPYRGITLSRLIPALQTGHTCLFGLVSNHWCKQGQQKRCPHKLMTASLAVSKQMLHSKVLSWLVLSPAPLLLLLPLVPPVLELFVDAEVVGPLLAILGSCPDTRARRFSCWNPALPETRGAAPCPRPPSPDRPGSAARRKGPAYPCRSALRGRVPPARSRRSERSCPAARPGRTAGRAAGSAAA